MKILIESGKASELYYNGKYYPTCREIDVSFSDALRLTRVNGVNAKLISPTKETYDKSIFKKDTSIAMLADIDTVSGWGNVGLNLVKYSAPYVTTSLIGRLNKVEDSYVLAASQREVNPHQGIVIHEQPKEEWSSLPFERKIAIVPFETTRVPGSWVSRINNCKALIVPCAQNVQMMKDSGVTIPIEVVHWGIDPTKFYPLERKTDRPFTFGIMGSLSKRKGIDILVDAFFKAFPTEQDVRLICKTSNNYFLWGVKDKRMKIDMTPVSHDELINDFFKEIDCFVLPTRGEGAGIPIIEAQSTGIPVIATGWSGPADYMTEETGWFIDYTMDEAVDFNKNVYKEFCGDWATPSIAHLIQLLRYAYEHRDEVHQKGKNAAQHVKDSLSWDKTILEYVDALEKHL